LADELQSTGAVVSTDMMLGSTGHVPQYDDGFFGSVFEVSV